MLIIGHRGAAGEAPENTLYGIQHCLKNNVSDFEIDLRLSADQKIIVFHDYNLLRTTGIDKNVGELTASELACINVLPRKNTGNKLPDPIPNVGIPTLKNLLALSKQATSFQLEVKSDEQLDKPLMIKKMGELFSDTTLKPKMTVTSFDADFLQQLKVTFPQIPIGLVSMTDTEEALNLALQMKCTHLCLKASLVDLWSEAIKAQLKKSRLHISLWTVNNKDFIEEAKTLPVDSIISDHPTHFV